MFDIWCIHLYDYFMEYLLGKKKSYKKLLFVFLIIFLAFLILSFLFLRHELPQLDGELKLNRLTSEVHIKRDQFGIPHINAKNSIDAYRALGFVVASERLFQMEVQRRMAFGELSEIFGEKALATDKLFRTLGLKQFVVEMLELKKQQNSIDPQMWLLVEAFYDGVNQFQESGRLPVEFKLLKINPRPFSVIDGYGFMGLMSFSFAISTNQDPLLTSLKSKFGENFLNDLRNESSTKTRENGKGVSTQNSSNRIVSIIDDLQRGFPLFDGSNGWVISGKRTKSGFPILANDPHISYSQPGVWFEAHLNSPDYEMYGHFLSIIPFPVLGHNQNFGWGLTMSLIDDMDLYQEELNPTFKTYKFGEKALFYTEKIEKILIKNSKPIEILVKKTHHGPILDEVLTESQKSLALNWSFLNPNNDPLTALYKMGRAHSMQEFKKAVSLGIAPGLNVLYADRQNIAWWIFGEIKSNPTNLAKDFILDGASGNQEQGAALKFDQKPFQENPKEGYIVSANARPSMLPLSIRGDWQPDDRYKTIKFLLDQKEFWDVADTKNLQTLNFNMENKRLLNILLSELNQLNIWQKEKSHQIVNKLKNWNFNSSEDSVEASVFYKWCFEITELMLKDLSQKERESFYKLPNHWIFFKNLVLNPTSSWWENSNRVVIFTKAFNNTLENLTQEFGEDYRSWKWGHMHTLEFVHPLGRKEPLNLIFNIGPVPIGGAYNEINNQKHSGYGDYFHVRAGPSTRRIIDFSNPSIAWGVLPTGNSGHILSDFYKDQLPLFVRGEYRYELLDKKLIDSQATHHLIMIPN